MHWFLAKNLAETLQRRIQNPVKHPRWSVLRVYLTAFSLLTIFAKRSILCLIEFRIRLCFEQKKKKQLEKMILHKIVRSNAYQLKLYIKYSYCRETKQDPKCNTKTTAVKKHRQRNNEKEVC